MSGMNKIPNSDIIGYEGPVGHEKKFHKDHFDGIDIVGGAEWHIWSDGSKHRFKEKPKETRKTGRESAEE